MPKILLSCLLGAAALIAAGCGGSNPTPDRTTTVAEDPAPVEQKNSGDDCDAKGINATEGKTGTCTIDDVTYRVVDRRDRLKLQRTTTALKDVYVLEEVGMPDGYAGEPVKPENGRFVVLRIGVRNNSNQPLEKALLAPSAALIVGRNEYASSDDGAAAYYQSMNLGLPQSNTIQPKTASDALVVFDLTPGVARAVNRRGSSLRLGSSNADESSLVGVIRLWK
ncbi:hypothetical protein [Conexibacter arvalis]|uniref:DUF4352 domain-containing protein n=1 Tax=Conexibacter arvalis TaxID=912552 RepID=A0A840IDJ2_9ACTN|nr:hypothetical protein [Conexibacter arvalis]MBB4663027.1 hypothetical protein [Conexibacter arvalis]